MKTRHQISGFLFLFSSALPLILTVCLTIKRADIRHRMRDGIRTEVLQTVTIPVEEVIWMDDHEIWVNESMFDIHSKKEANGLITFTGLYDEEETLLVNRERNSRQSEDGKNKILLRLFKCLPLACTDHTAINLFEPVSLNRKFVFFSSKDVWQYYDIITPPPRSLHIS